MGSPVLANDIPVIHLSEAISAERLVSETGEQHQSKKCLKPLPSLEFLSLTIL